MRKPIAWTIGAITLVGMILISGELVAGRWQPRPVADWANLQRGAQSALAKAEAAAIAVGHRELHTWHVTLMASVDQRFLDEHLSLSNKWNSTARYLWTWAVSDSDTALAEQIERQDTLFQQTVISSSQQLEDMKRIAIKMLDAFGDSLDRQLAEIARKHRLSNEELDRGLAKGPYLNWINILPNRKQTPLAHSRYKVASRSLDSAWPNIVSALNGLRVITSVELISGLRAKGVAGGVVGHATKKTMDQATKVAAQKAVIAGTAKVGTATIAKGGGALLSGPFAIVVVSGVIAWEWWDHSKSVAEQKPKLLEEISRTFLSYEAQLLEPDGHLGNAVRQLRLEIEKAIAG